MDFEKMLNIWQKMSGTPLGRKTFSFLLGKAAPYTGSVKPEILEIKEGTARVQMRDRRAVRNHLKSVHALALANVGELSTGLAVLSCLPKNMRYIITNLSIEFLKKARGTVTATASCPKIEEGTSSDVQVISQITDPKGVLVARVTAHWRIGPNPK